MPARMDACPALGSWRQASVLVGIYGLLVAFLTWPLLLHAATHHLWVISSFDWFFTTWSLAWESHALLHHPSRFAQANIFHPTPDTLFYGSASLGALPLFAPVFALSGNPTLAINLTFLGGLTLTAWGLHCIVRGWTGSHLAGFIAAATFLTSRFLRFLPPSSPQYAALLYFPWILWLSAKPILSPGRAILLALLIALQCLVETVYVAPAVVAPIAVLAAVLLLRGETRARGLRLAIALLGGLLLVSPVYLAYLHVMDQNPNLGQQTSWPSDPRAPRSFEDLLLWTFQVPVSAVWITPLTLILAALGLFAFLRRRRSTTPEGWRRAFTQGLLWFVVCLLLSLAPRLRLGDEVIRLPLGYLQDWFSALQALRVPGRVALGSLIGLAVLAGVAFAAIEAWLRTGIADARRASAAVIALSAVAGCAAYLQDKELSYPVRLSQSPQVDAALLPALRAGRGPMVVLPPDGYPNARAMFQSIYHWRPILNGYSSYWPDGFAERMARAKRLPHPQALEKLVKETRLKLVWLNLRGELTRRQRQAWARAVKQGRFRQVATTDEVWLLRVQPAPPRPTPQASVLQGQPASSPASGGGT